ncbi:DNA recombination and repair protein Rad51-like [Theobroma cacao]|nr:DNA recombination and repair protein Rad51-like [Theobroma cacao]
MKIRAEEASQLQLVEREDIDDEEDLFEAIDKLISAGINAGDVKKLQDAGIYTCNGLMMHTKKHLTGIKGLSEAKVDKICEAAEKIVNYGYITGSDALLRRKSVIRITTGSQALDELLGGNFCLLGDVILLLNDFLIRVLCLAKHSWHILYVFLHRFLSHLCDP